jgi:NADH-quinone oxidoreductase subunit I
VKFLLQILRKIFFIDLLQGMAVTQKYFGRKKVTVQYPKERIDVRSRVEYNPAKGFYTPGSGRFRGLLRLVRDPATGEELCIGCGSCMRICPTACIAVEGEKRPDGKGRRHKSFRLDIHRCLSCDLCVEVCPTSAIIASNEYELATYSRDDFIYEIPTLYGRPPITEYKK